MSDVVSRPTARKRKTVNSTVETDFVRSLFSISKAVRALIGLKLHGLGFHNGQDEFLLELEEERPISVTAVAERLSVRPSTVSKMANRLVQSRLVERTADEADGRRTLIRITPAGLDARSQILRVREQIEAELLAALAAEKDATVSALVTVATEVQSRLSRYR